MTEMPRAKGLEEIIPKKSTEMGVEEKALKMYPRKEGPENDSGETLKR